MKTTTLLLARVAGYLVPHTALFVVPGAGHVDLYDGTDLIPFDKLGRFFQQHLAALE